LRQALARKALPRSQASPITPAPPTSSPSTARTKQVKAPAWPSRPPPAPDCLTAATASAASAATLHPPTWGRPGGCRQRHPGGRRHSLVRMSCHEARLLQGPAEAPRRRSVEHGPGTKGPPLSEAPNLLLIAESRFSLESGQRATMPLRLSRRGVSLVRTAGASGLRRPLPAPEWWGAPCA
jgi:hypothetical protein